VPVGNQNGAPVQRTRVFLADDHSLLLEAFSTLLEPKFDVVGTAVDGREMLSAVKKIKPDVVVLDINMPNLNGFDAGEKLKKLFPDIKLLFLTVNEDPELVTEAFRIGANGYLLKNSAASELFQAIDAVMAGGNYVTPGIARDMISSFIKNPSGQGMHSNLTLRQREVLQLLAEGKTMKEIASILNITPRTVAFHKYQIMEELDIKTNSELVKYAIKHGYVT
jgi:DNA-binding NarL/FixJ family response regulator